MANLLLVDDDVAVLHFVRTAIRDLADLRVARTGRDALRLLRMARPDLLILDLQLGDANGLDLLESIRADVDLADIPVLFLSSQADPLVHVQALALGALDWLTKPLDERDLRDRIQFALGRSASGARLALRPSIAEPVAGACVLAVDDDPIMLDAIASALAPQHLQFLRATDALQALELARQQVPELVVLDVRMPGIDGFELARQLLAMPQLADTPIIFVTQLGEPDTELQALALGAFDFVSKPFVPAVLQARVCNALRLRRRSVRAVAQAEAHWRRVSGDQLTAIVAHAREPILVLDAQGRVMLSNRAASGLIGPPALRAELPRWLADSLPPGLIHGGLQTASGVALTRPDGCRLVYDISASPCDQGETQLLTLTFHDQTQRIQAEEQARIRLRLASESEARRLMVSFLAHEIANPLNGILGLTRSVRMATDMPLTPDQDRRLAMVQDCAEVLHRLMKDVLDLSCIESGQFAVDPKDLLVRPIIDAALAAHEPAAHARDIQLLPAIGEPEAVVRADPVRLRQCLDNLLSNACKYGRSGGCVQVEVAAQAENIIMTVADNGEGLTPQQIQRLFVPFDRLGRQDSPGHGLGLSITHQLAQAMGGGLNVAAQAGIGSRFSLTLPKGSAAPTA